MSQSLMKALKKQDPSCHIDVYAPAYALPVLDRMPEADCKLVNPFAHGELSLKKRFSEGRRLARNNYDTAFILPNSLKSALVPFFAGIPDRRGFKGESRYLLINHMRNNPKDFPRMVERYVALAYSPGLITQATDLPPLELPALKHITPTYTLLHELQISFDRPCLALGCGANYGPSKLWPVEYFGKVCDWWIESGGSVLGLGTKKDAPTVAAVKNCVKPDIREFFYDIAGKTDLCQALDLVACCNAAVCNDSGMMHTVAAVNVPQVCIFGSTSTLYTPPLSDKAFCLEARTACHPCFKRTCALGTYECLKSIKPESVISKLQEFAP